MDQKTDFYYSKICTSTFIHLISIKWKQNTIFDTCTIHASCVSSILLQKSLLLISFSWIYWTIFLLIFLITNFFFCTHHVVVYSCTFDIAQILNWTSFFNIFSFENKMILFYISQIKTLYCLSKLMLLKFFVPVFHCKDVNLRWKLLCICNTILI